MSRYLRSGLFLGLLATALSGHAQTTTAERWTEYSAASGLPAYSALSPDVALLAEPAASELPTAATAPAAGPDNLRQFSPLERYQMGRQDARLSYQPAKKVFWGSFAAAIVPLGPVSGLGTAVAIGVTPPKLATLTPLAPANLQDPDYLHGYQRQAQRRKRTRAFVGAGTGTVVLVGLSVVAGALLMRQTSGSAFSNLY